MAYSGVENLNYNQSGHYWLQTELQISHFKKKSPCIQANESSPLSLLESSQAFVK